MRTAIYVGLAGFLGSIARYLVAGAVSDPGEVFPRGTFVVNITGCFALGFLVSAFAHRFVVHPDLRVAITVGFLGAYTTFSTFALETYEFNEVGQYGWAAANILASVAVGLVAVWLGARLGQAL